ncbi:MAG: chemotaxis response regulator protein-glutamate methylesterase [Firmicutes bacterium]|nr:chemotaxis response regulator protein-glutamate methylesterase [Bacillota bacterium]
MRQNKKIRVLVVDDSLVFREIISIGIATDPYIEVVAKAGDPFAARDKLVEFKPDVMTCDVEMPKMNGIEFIRRLLPQYPLPVVVVSSMSGKVFDAMNAGAVDFLTKPDAQSVKGVEAFINELIVKIKIASIAKVTGTKSAPGTADAAGNGGADTSGRIIAMGASTGGTEALYSVITSLPPDAPGVVVVQHIPPVYSRMFAERLNSASPLNVKEARTGDVVEPGVVLIAPGDQHLKVRKTGDRYRVNCQAGEKVNGHCPSVDVLFESVARAAGDRAIGVILTGMGYDGARGLLAMKRKGAKTIGQDEKTCVVYGMPRVAYEIGAVDRQAPLGNIPQVLFEMLKEKK